MPSSHRRWAPLVVALALAGAACTGADARGSAPAPAESTPAPGDDPTPGSTEGTASPGDGPTSTANAPEADGRIEHGLDPVALLTAVEERSGKDLTYASCVANMILSAVEHGELPEETIGDWLATTDPAEALPSTDSLRPAACPGA